ncbi:hypothetical protein ID1017_01270 [Helicobacter pylori]
MRAIPSFLKKQESIKEYLKAKDIYIVFDSDNQTKETKIQEIKEQLQENPKEEHCLSDEEFNQIKIFYCQKMMRLNTISNYCGLEHSLEKMAKESENKAFHASFCQHYNALLDKVFEENNEDKTFVRKERKKRAKCWLQPYITLSICLERDFVPCGLNDLDPVTTTTKMPDKPKKTEILKKLFNFDLKNFKH